MDNPVCKVMQLVYKFKLKRPDYQFRKNQGKWQCTCVIKMDSKTIEETTLAPTKKEAKAQSSLKSLSTLESYLEKNVISHSRK